VTRTLLLLLSTSILSHTAQSRKAQVFRYSLLTEYGQDNVCRFWTYDEIVFVSCLIFVVIIVSLTKIR